MKLLPVFWKWLAVIVLTPSAATSAWAKDAINVYGPGGPAPAMQEAAKAFGAAHDVTVNVTAGPTAQWLEQAKQDADVVFSGAAKQQWTEQKDIDAWLTWNI